MKNVKVGVAFEGGNDGEVLLVWVKRLLFDKGFSVRDDDVVWVSPNTGLLGYVSSCVKKFVDENVDIAVFCTDQDEDTDSRIARLSKKIEETDLLFKEKVAIAVPTPHIEQWLLLQDDVIKNILKLDGAEPLPHGENSPKTRLTLLYNEAEEYTGSQQQLRIEIAEKMNLNYCTRRDNHFKRFIKDLEKLSNDL